MHELDASLERAYRSARYVIAASPQPVVLRVDEFSASLQTLLSRQAVTSAAVLTACNPHSVIQTPDWNARAMQSLRAALHALDGRALEGENQDPDGHWPVEPSLLVLGLPRSAVRQLAAQYDQAAFLWIDINAVPRLIVTAARESD
jgi:hypothetical protein